MLRQPAIDPLASAFGLGALALLMLGRRWKPTFPGVLVIVVLAAALSWAIGFEAGGGAVVGALPQGLPALYLPRWPGWHTLGQLVLPTLVITLVSFLETASSAKVDSQRKGERWDQDQDLIGQGLAKIASGLWARSPPAPRSRARRSTCTPARTGWATVVSVGVVLVALLVFTPVLRHVPQAVLAAMVVAAVLTGLIKPREFLRLWHMSRVEAVIAAHHLRRHPGGRAGACTGAC
jgi:SulP family sulfate permease